jgi:hypothetical protein
MIYLEDNSHVVGTFHLAQLYDLNVWEENEDCEVFACKEQDENDGEIHTLRKIVITPSVLLLF